MKKNRKEPRRSPPKSGVSPQRVLLIVAELPETELPLIFFPARSIHISVPESKLLEMKGAVSSHIVLGHAEKYIQEGTKLNPIPYPVGILSCVSSTTYSEGGVSFILEPGVRVKLIDPTIEPVFTTAWKLMLEEKPSEEEFRSDGFKQKLSRLKAALMHEKISLEGDDEKKLFDLATATNDSIGDIVDRWAFVCYPFVRTPYVLDALQKILAEVNVTSRIDLLIGLFEYMGRNSKLVTDNLRTAGSSPSSSYDERYEEIRDRLPEEAREEIERELARLKQGGYQGEVTAIKNHIDWLLRLFSLQDTEDNRSLEEAGRILEEDHYGLMKVKEQILEFLAVRKHVPSGSGDILCFVGPPGIGKTSLGKSIARALNRKFTRLSLGGITDVGEIRGHELIYIRTHPGHIVQNLVASGSHNPVFVLDEIDKIGEHWRGDPAAALLAVLDPEQNIEFLDTFINVPFDLSHILFICTANNIEGIPRPLQDRMEIISLPGYTPLEKLAIGRQYLVPKQREKQGFPLQRQGQQPLNILISDGALRRLIEEYTKEAGVRQIEREVRRIFRRVARRSEQGEFASANEIQVTAQNLHIFAGKSRIYPKQRFDNMPIGCVPMFAVSDEGGHFFYVEVLMERSRSQRKIKVTGVRGSGQSRERMNNLIEESFDVAFDSLMLEGGILHETSEEKQQKGEFYIHVHVRDGATPKDGPSAGIPAIAAAFGLLTNTSIAPFVGATGEIDLKLGILEPIGGLKEKSLAAHDAGIKRFVIPKDNERDLEDIPPEIKSEITFIPCRSVWKALLEFFPDNELILRHIEGKTEWSS